MDAAAESIRGLRHLLPDRPHQLAKSSDWVVKEYPQDSRFIEEREISRLGYMTYLSNADRDVLFTRGYDDIRPVPKPMPNQVNVLAKTGTQKKRLSVNDYLKKKSNAPSPDLTPSSTPKKVDSPKPDTLKPPQVDATGRPKPATDGKEMDKRLPSKPPGLPPKPPTPDDVKKRRAQDEGGRATKRQRPSDIDSRADREKDGRPRDDQAKSDRVNDERLKDPRSKDERSREKEKERERIDRAKEDQVRDEVPRRKPQEGPLSRDFNPAKDKPPRDRDRDRDRDQNSALLNGRASTKAAATSRASSPPSRAQGDSVNGLGLINGSERKTAVPKLLSPLRISFDDADKVADSRLEKKRRIEEAPAQMRKPADKAADKSVERTTSAKNSESQPPPKRQRLPPILSPTLPPMVEAELERVESSSRKDAEQRPRGERERQRDAERDREGVRENVSETRADRNRDKDTQRKKDNLAVARRPADDSSPSPDVQSRSSLIVTLKIPKSLRQQYKLMMKIARSSAIGAQRADKRAEKRPISSGEASSEALKRPRPAPPSTPSKKGATAMSRVSSNNSMAHTPGDPVAATPNVPDSEGRSQPELRDKDRARIQLLKEKEAEFKNFGRTLKHKSDAILLPRRDPSKAPNGTQQPSKSDVKLAWAQLLESLLCFICSFHCADIQRQILGQRRDSVSWNSIGPLALVLETELRSSKSRHDAPVVALKTFVQLIANDQYLAAVASQAEPSPDMAKTLRCERARTNFLTQLRKVNDSIESKSLKVTFTPWALDDTVTDMLRVTQRWCADEGVNWSPSLNVKDCGLKG